MNYQIGQRVRVVVARICPAFRGLTGRIASPIQFLPNGRRPPYDPMEGVHQIEFDNLPGWAGGSTWHFAPWQLEPIVPERMAKVEWADCLWQPEHLRASVGKA